MATTLDSFPIRSWFRRGRICRCYNEAAFRHFLAVERARARRSRRVLYLALVAITHSPGRAAQISDLTAADVFRGLDASVREVDFVGWFREGQVAAAVLVQIPQLRNGDVAPMITKRIVTELKKRLSTTHSSVLRVRVIRLGGSAEV